MVPLFCDPDVTRSRGIINTGVCSGADIITVAELLVRGDGGLAASRSISMDIIMGCQGVQLKFFEAGPGAPDRAQPGPLASPS